ncbi:MAG: hypothetical protein GY717_20465 [Rhodobacteraceae bacterium]|nr:hypothetical protein [Paracoccaceae bacterium]
MTPKDRFGIIGPALDGQRHRRPSGAAGMHRHRPGSRRAAPGIEATRARLSQTETGAIIHETVDNGRNARTPFQFTRI